MNAIIPEHLIPLQKFRHLRTVSPVRFDKDSNQWSVYKYEDVKTVFADYERFSSKMREPTPEEPIDASILRKDPPDHRKLRALVSQAFTPKAVEALAPLVRSVTDRLLDEAEAKGEIDALRDFAGPLPVLIIAEMLGIPKPHIETFKRWSDELVSPHADSYFRSQKEMSAYFADIAETRRKAPQDDLISRLVAASVENERLSGLELIGFCILLLVAGNETTTNLISSAILCLDGSEDARGKLIGNPAAVAGAVEETLRYCSPVQHMIRRVVRDTELRGQHLSAGQIVQLWIGSANHDEEAFDGPETFDIDRGPNPHLAFGHGIHFCLGSQLARLEADIAIRALLERFPNFARDRSHELERMDSTIVFGVKRLPVKLRP
ncbi:cytochrome P450 [Paenibacillus sp. GYB003]|uniref:cytochrome P450 n=1 Tax=Paenibacillus sp. GYB003 TaxID=2994392 RepID=UPI002F968D7B